MDSEPISFIKLNDGWNAEPNAPGPIVSVDKSDVVLRFALNRFVFHEFDAGDIGVLRFVDAEQFRLGPTDDEGFYKGQCRFGRFVPAWGEFYEVSGSEALLNAPADWTVLRPQSGTATHYLFYLRDETFECIAERCEIDNHKETRCIALGNAFPA